MRNPEARLRRLEEASNWTQSASELTAQLEAGAASRPALETQIFLASIAISLKRIADSLDKR